MLAPLYEISYNFFIIGWIVFSSIIVIPLSIKKSKSPVVTIIINLFLSVAPPLSLFFIVYLVNTKDLIRDESTS